MSFACGQQTQGLRQMRLVNHFAVELQSTRASGLREGVDDALRILQFFGRGGEALVDDGDLVRVYGQFAAEALAACTPHIGLQALVVAKVNRQRVNGLNAACVAASRHSERASTNASSNSPSSFLLLVAPTSVARSSAPQVSPARRGEQPA